MGSALSQHKNQFAMKLAMRSPIKILIGLLDTKQFLHSIYLEQNNDSFL